MSKTPIALIIAGAQLVLAQPQASAAQTGSPATVAAAPAASSAESAQTTEPPKKRGLFRRMFGRGKKDEESSQAAKPAGKPSPEAAKAGTPKPEAAKTDATTKPALKPQPTPAKAPKTSAATPATSGKKPGKGQASSVSKAGTSSQPPDTNDPAALEKWKYNQAKAKASEDPEVRNAKEKADSALTDEEGRAALKAYNRALFDKMRQIDPSITERIDVTEAAIMKRLNGKE